MGALALQGTGPSGVLTGGVPNGIVVVALVVVLGVLLVVIRVSRARAARRRKAAGSVYFDRDAAHYGPAGRDSLDPDADRGGSSGTTRAPRHSTVQPTAPSFNAPTASHRSRLRPRATLPADLPAMPAPPPPGSDG